MRLREAHSTVSGWVRKHQREEFFWLRVLGGATGTALAVAAAASGGIDGPFLLIVGITAFVISFPWQRLSALKAGPFELSLMQGQIKAVVDSIEIQGDAKERLSGLLGRLRGDIELARGARVLWVDDIPHRVVAERRLFRALEIETVMVPSSRDAAEALRRDNEFDLVVTSLYKREEMKQLSEERRRKKKEKAKRGEERSEADADVAPTFRDGRPLGVLFVLWLRGGADGDPRIREIYGKEIGDRVVNNLPVIFYVAKVGMGEIRRATLPAAELEPRVEVSKKMDDFLAKAIRMLADARAEPISVPAEKELF